MECLCQPMLQPDLTPVIGAIVGALLLGVYLIAWGIHLLDRRPIKHQASTLDNLQARGAAARRAMDHTTNRFIKQVTVWLRR